MSYVKQLSIFNYCYVIFSCTEYGYMCTDSDFPACVTMWCFSQLNGPSLSYRAMDLMTWTALSAFIGTLIPGEYWCILVLLSSTICLCSIISSSHCLVCNNQHWSDWMWFDNYILTHAAVSWKTHGTKHVVLIHLYKPQHMFITIHLIGVSCLKHNPYSIGHYSAARVTDSLNFYI